MEINKKIIENFTTYIPNTILFTLQKSKSELCLIKLFIWVFNFLGRKTSSESKKEIYLPLAFLIPTFLE